MSDHPSLHDPFFYESSDFEDNNEPRMNDIEEMIRETGGAFIYNPHNNDELFTFEWEHNRYWVERQRILATEGDRIVVSLVHLQDCVENLDELSELYPEWTQQQVFPLNIINKG